MAISVNPITKVISIPQADLTLVSGTLYELNLNTLRLWLKEWEYSVEGIVQTKTNDHASEFDLGTFVLGRSFKILPPYSIEFENGAYTVNLLDAHANVSDVASGILVQNQVQVIPPQLPGLVGNREIVNQSYIDGKVFINVSAGSPVGAGTPTDPVDNFTRADEIAGLRRLLGYDLVGSIALTASDNTSGRRFIGQDAEASIITATNMNVASSLIENVMISGSLNGRATFVGCIFGNTTGLKGKLSDCTIAGNITLDAAAVDPIIIRDCESGVAGTGKPGFDCNGTAAGINFRRYAGGGAITNFNNASGAMTLDLMGSEFSLNSANCTAGTIVARGVGRLIDENGDLLPLGNTTWNGITLRNYVVDNTNIINTILDTNLPRP